MKDQRGHVLVLTYPAQGHINPLLQFAKRLGSKGLRATFATTTYAVKSIQVEATNLNVEAISDGYDRDGFRQAPSLKAYAESFRTNGSRTLAELIMKFSDSASPVNCLVYDSLFPWALDVARSQGIFAAAFLTNSASVCSLYWQIRLNRISLPVKEDVLPLSMPGLPPLELSDLPSFIAQPADHAIYLGLIMEKFNILEQNDWVFCNTFDDLESKLTKAMSGLCHLMTIGPMVPSAYLDQQIHGDTAYGASLWKQDSDQCLRWLETKRPKSVVYVSFGSMADIAVKQVEEIAWGLEAREKHFLWVVREGEHQKWPVEFLKVIDGKGLVVTWCNQLEVLAHQAVACFVTHCGWNSTLEGLSLGVPMVGLPQWSDQPSNAKFLEVWGVGVRAKKNVEGIVPREEIDKCIKEIMAGERSKEINKNSALWRELAKKAVSLGGSSDKNINEFVAMLQSGKGKIA